MSEIDSLLDELARLGFLWFEDNRQPDTGLVLDRALNRRGATSHRGRCSIASCGYYLSLLPEWVRLGRIDRAEAERQALQTTDFFWKQVAHCKGMFYHFIDWSSGARWGNSGVSVLDTSIFLNGCIVVSESFQGSVAVRTTELLDRVDWNAFLVRHPPTGKSLLSLGWTPEGGLTGHADVRSSELAMPYFLAVASRTHPIDAQCWYNTAVNWGELAGIRVLNPLLPLFCSYYGLGWHELKGLTDREGVDMDHNARSTALANRLFCRQQASQFATFGQSAGGWWGISAGDNADGYIAAAPVAGTLDGTVWPLAALAAIPWVPAELCGDLARWRASNSWHIACGDYGLSPFNLDRKLSGGRPWVGEALIGIDVGSLCVSLANYRHRTVWELWRQHPVATAAIERLEYKPRQ